jgi:hypothetical protein
MRLDFDVHPICNIRSTYLGDSNQEIHDTASVPLVLAQVFLHLDNINFGLDRQTERERFEITIQSVEDTTCRHNARNEYSVFNSQAGNGYQPKSNYYEKLRTI